MDAERWPFPISERRLDEGALAWAEQSLLDRLPNDAVAPYWKSSDRDRRRRVAETLHDISVAVAADLFNANCVAAVHELAPGRAYALRTYADLFLRPEPCEAGSDFVYVCDRFRACICATENGSWPMVVHFGMSERNKPISFRDYDNILRNGGESPTSTDLAVRLDPSFAAFHLAMYWPNAAAHIAEVKESNPFLAGWLTAMTYTAAKKKRGSPYRGPSAYTAVRVWTIEGLRRCCGLSAPQAMAVWNHWFPSLSYSESVTGDKHYAKDRASVASSLGRMFGREFSRLARSEQRRVDAACQSYYTTYAEQGREIILSPEDDAKIWACLKKLGAVAEVTDVTTGQRFLARCTECELPGCNCDVSFEALSQSVI